MNGVIIESGTENATDTDLLTSTRLQTAPADGVMLFQLQAADNVAANHFVVDIQLPDSDVPLIAQNVPGGQTAGLGGQLDTRFMLQYAAQVGKGGRVVFGITETGDTECEWRVVFTPNTR